MLLTAAPDPILQATSIVQASAAVATFLVAGIAAVVAYFQVREARHTREDQARPYVAAYLETDGFVVELVVKNFGNSVARNVTMTPDVPMLRGALINGQPDPIGLFESLPVLVPSQEWRTLFDTGPNLKGDQPVYTVTLKYDDARNHPLPSDEFRLDWHQFESALLMDKKDLDDVGKALEKIANTVGNWTEGLRGLKVFTRSGAEKDQKEREWAAEAPARRQAMRDAQAATQAQAAADEAAQAGEKSEGEP